MPRYANSSIHLIVYYSGVFTSVWYICGQLSFHLRSLQMEQHNKGTLLPLMTRRIQGIMREQFSKDHHEQKPLQRYTQ